MPNTGERKTGYSNGLLATILIGISFSLTAAAAPPGSEISFHSEKISISISENRIEIDAEYYFTGPDNRVSTARLYYPFPVDSLHPFPEDISVNTNGQDIKFWKSDNGIYFDVSVDTNGTGRVDVRYVQSCLVPSGCYILTSTAEWGKPLTRAEFEITIPWGMEILGCSYEPDTVITETDSIKYLMVREDFLPEEDLCLEWLKPE